MTVRSPRSRTGSWVWSSWSCIFCILPVPEGGDISWGDESLLDAGACVGRGMSPGRRGAGREAATYLAVEQTMNEEDEGSLQAVDDGEQVSHDIGHGSNLENAQHPGTPQDEDLGKGFECQ